MNIAFRVDASTQMGTGHFMRCLTLASEMRRGGARTRFLCRALPDFLAELLRGGGHELSRLPATATQDTDEGPSLSHTAWLGASQADDATQSLLALDDVVWDWLVVDHYALDARWESRIRTRALRVFCIDDLADRNHACDGLLDQNIQTAAGRYERVAPNCTLFLGTGYTLLRPEFATLREKTLNVARPTRLHIFMGGTDPKGGTVRVLEGLQDFPQLDTDVILGNGSPFQSSVEALCRKLPRAKLHIQVRDMAALLSHATLAIGAGGSASWERCCLGIPTLVMSFAENQRSSCSTLAATRAAINLGDLTDLTAQHLSGLLGRVLARPSLLAKMARRAATLVDGRGARRIADFLWQPA
jgi:UDP-2,4-diacetamido-2,4,6-trideoxy-beta-L-altropyranose hydrolase